MEKICWVDNGRYGSLRSYTYEPTPQRLTILCKKVMYVSYTDGKNPETGERFILSVDPDGGPYIRKGGRLYPPSPYPTLHILRIDKETYSNKTLTIIATVEEAEAGTNLV